MSKKILVTGGAGFLGSYLCDKLIKENNEVICVDNFYTSKKENIIHLLDNRKFEMIRHDITFPLYLEGIDQIYNLACPASPIHYQRNPVFTVKTNVHGSINMLGLAKRIKSRILQSSTSEVYGNSLVHPQNESYNGNVNPIGIRSCYDEGKRCAETLFFDYHRQYGVDIRVARIFNTYGPGMQENDGRVVSNFIIQALKGDNITLYGDGSQTRSFCYIDDTIKGLQKLMNSDFIGPVNIGNTIEITVRELAEKIIKLTNSKSDIIFKPIPLDDPEQRQPNIQLAKEKLNWEPVVSIEDGLSLTIEYFSNRLNSQSPLG